MKVEIIGIDAQACQKAGKRSYEEVKVLKETQNAEICTNTKRQPSLLDPFSLGIGGFVQFVDFYARDVVNDSRDENQREEAPIPVAIKNIGSHQKHIILQSEWQQPVEEEDNRKENGKRKGIE